MPQQGNFNGRVNGSYHEMIFFSCVLVRSACCRICFRCKQDLSNVLSVLGVYVGDVSQFGMNAFKNLFGLMA